MDDLICVSINYKKCGEEVRGKFAFAPETREKFITEHSALSPVLLCTCNRTELYMTGGAGGVNEGMRLLSELSGVPRSRVEGCAMLFSGEGAVRHLFRVACGVDSMVVGEDEILGQLRNAYSFSAELIQLSHRVNIIFQSAVTTAKRIKTETAISRTSVSHATLAAKLAAHSAPEVRVLLIGASGKTGTSLLKNLLSYKNVTVLATMRSHSGQTMLLPDSPALTVVPYEERYSFIAESSCVISATSSPHTVLTADRLREYCSGEKLLIDLAVPRDIDPAAAEIPGVTLRSVDYFSSLAEDNNLRKQNSVEQAGQMIDEDIGELRKTLLLHEKLPLIRQGGALSGLTAEELLFRLKKELSAAAFAEVVGCVLGEKG